MRRRYRVGEVQGRPQFGGVNRSLALLNWDGNICKELGGHTVGCVSFHQKFGTSMAKLCENPQTELR